jgi:predicted esterase
MKKLYIVVTAVLLLLILNAGNIAAQGVLNPDDPIVNYDRNNPPATPPYGTVAKWVRTPTLNWNTEAWKAYYYNGMDFRLLYPKSYKTNPNKKYPLLIFFHGVGEIGSVYDNELQLKNCGKKIQDSVLNGTFDAFVLFPQAQFDYWTSGYLSTIAGFVNYMANNARLDLNRISVSGLSEGGEAAWAFTQAYPKLVAASIPMSAASSNQTTSSFINTVKDIPIWLSQGGKDTHPAPSAGDNVAQALRDAGVDIQTVNPKEAGIGTESEGYYVLYPDLGHNTWDAHYAEPQAFQFMLRANKANPHVYFGRREFCPGTPINVKLELTPGFNGYEWSRNGVVIAGANSNSLTVTDTGTYAARIKNGNEWSDWSPWPAHITYKATTLTPPIQVSGLMSRVIPAPDGNTSVKLEEPIGYASYQWRNGAGQVVGNDRIFTATQPGKYVATVTEQYGCSATPSDTFYVAPSSGPNAPDPATNVTGYAVSQTSVQVNWSNNLHPVRNETAFEVYRGLSSSGPYKLVGITPADSLGFVDENLSANTQYYYIVRAVDSSAAAAVSNVASVLTLVDQDAPTAPANLRVVSTTSSSVTLAWNASSDNASVKNYSVYVNGVKSYITTDTTFTAYNLTHGQVYSFVVKATDPTGNVSVASNQVVAPAAFQGLTYKYYTGTWSTVPNFSNLTPVSTGTGSNVSLSPATQSTNYGISWEGHINISRAGTYTFYTSSDDGSKLYINNSLVVNNDGLHGTQEKSGNYTFPQAGSYPFRVDFFQQGGGAALTTSWRATSLGISKQLIPDNAFKEEISIPGTVPAIPTNITANALSYDSVSVSWNDNSNNETGFEIYRSNAADGVYQIIATTASNKTSFIDTTVSPSTTYYYKIQAINQYGSSGFDLGSMGGLHYGYYESSSFTTMPDFNALTPVKSGNASNISLDVKERSQDYALKFSGSINIPTSGSYTFYTRSDDGSNLYIDGFDAAHQVVNNNYLQGPTERQGTVTLSAGIHPIYITFFQHGGGDLLEASYQGPGIGKQHFPDAVFANGHNKATTPSLPAVPPVPAGVVAHALSTNAIELTWTDGSTRETGFIVYRSDGNNTSYRQLQELPANTTAYKDSGLYSNTRYYYKVRSENAGGMSQYSAEVYASTQNNLPQLSNISDQSIRYGTTAQINISASDDDGEPVALSAQNLPPFGSIQDYGDGTGLLTFAPSAVQQGTYNGIKVVASDQHGGRDSVIFDLTVNDNYPPVISEISPIQVNSLSSVRDTIYSTDPNVGDDATWSTTGLPNFVTATPTTDGRKLVLAINPSMSDTGNFSFQVSVRDGSNGMDEKTVNLTVNYVPLKRWYLNFRYQTSANSPWNNITSVSTNGLKDDQGQSSTVGLTLQTTWWNAFDGGAVTGNNSGVYPDNVIKDYYYFGIFGGPNVVNGTISGLNPGDTYSITFFSSSIWTNVSDNGYTVFQIGSQKDSIYVQANTNRTLTFHNITPAANGSVNFTMSKGLNTPVGYLNSMVISTEAKMAPAIPTGIQLKNASGSSGNQVEVSWHHSGNASKYLVYRSTKIDSTYTLLNPDASNGGDSTYRDQNVASQTKYFYYLVASNSVGMSAPSDTLSIVTSEATQYVDTRKWYINFRYQTSANSPWNNVTGVTTTGLKDDQGGSSNVSLSLHTSWWNAFNGGDVTGNNSGVYPDNVIVDYYYFGIFGGPNSVSGSVAGLNPDLQYSVTFFSSSIWSNVSDNGYTVFQIGSQKDSIYVQANRNRTLTFNHLQPSEDGSIDFTMSKGVNAPVGYINAMVVTTESATPPVKPINLSLTNQTQNSKNQVKVGWTAGSNNTGQFNVYRSTRKDSIYVLLNPEGGNGSATSFIDTTVRANTTYYYYLIGENDYGSSEPTDTLSIVTPSLPAPAPVIGAIADVHMAGGSTQSVPVTANVSDGSSISLSLNNAPSFVSIADNGNGTGQVALKPTASDVGFYDSVGVTAVTGNGARATKYFDVYVSDGGLTNAIYMNFTDVSHSYGQPWNNIVFSLSSGNRYSNLIDNFNKPTNVALTLVNAWSGVTNYGIYTYNNTGIFPDGVQGSNIVISDGNTRTVSVSGLDPTKRYNIVLFGSSYYNNYNFETQYTVGSQSITVDNTRNKTKLARFNGLTSDQNGVINVTVKKTAAANNGVLNVMVVEAYDNNTLVSPTKLRATSEMNNVKLIWTDRAYNETGFEIWRSTALDGSYSKIATVSADVTSYTDAAAAGNTRYFYKVRAIRSGTSSSYSNIASVTTQQFAVYVNFNQKEAGAPLPWNNTNHVPSYGDVYGPFYDQNGQGTNMTIEMESNFEGENNVGVVTGNNSGIYPDLVMQGEYYLDKGMDTVVMKLSNLNISKQYDLTFFGSLVNFGWNNTTVFIVNGQMTALTTTNNSTETTSLKGIYPDENGQIVIKINCTSDSRYAILGAMVIQVHNGYDDQGNISYGPLGRQYYEMYNRSHPLMGMRDLTKESTASGISVVNVYPNPFDSYVMISLSSATKDQLILSLYNTEGILVDQQNASIFEGMNSVKYEPHADLMTGVYVLSIKSKITGKQTTVKLIKLR